MVGVAAFVAQLPGVLAAKGWLEDAHAQSGDVVVETLSGLVAFILPGDDPYSEAQGTKTDEPGGIAAGTVPVFIRNLDAFVPVAIPGVGTETLPASGGVAMLLNRYALEVNPAAGNGDALSPFARLTFDEKAEVMRLLEADPLVGRHRVQVRLGHPAGLRRVPGVVRGGRDRPRDATADEAARRLEAREVRRAG